MKREEERSSVWYIVFLFPTFPRSVSHTLLCASRREEEEEEDEGEGGRGVVDPSQSLLTLSPYAFLQEDDSSYLCGENI